MQPVVQSQVWTFEDLLALPEDVDWRRYEIVDGALVVSPAARPIHELASSRLIRAVAPQLPQDVEIVGPIALDLAPSYRIPDLLVVPTEVFAENAPLVRPADALLVVEIVSPGSVTTDRITKPAQYAAAGIGAFWRVETAPEVSLTAYELHEGTYRELGTWHPGETAHVEVPFPVDVVIDDLVPPSASTRAAT